LGKVGAENSGAERGSLNKFELKSGPCWPCKLAQVGAENGPNSTGDLSGIFRLKGKRPNGSDRFGLKTARDGTEWHEWHEWNENGTDRNGADGPGRDYIIGGESEGKQRNPKR